MERTLEGFTWRTDELWTLFSEWVTAEPDAIAVIAGDRRVTRRELCQRAETVAAYFAGHGITTPQRVLVESHVGVDTLVLGLAVSRVGAVFCPMRPSMGSRDRRVIVDRLDPAVIIGRDAQSGSPVPGVESGLRAEMRHVSERGIPDQVPISTDEDRVSVIGFTSGTTGVPKAVMHTSSALTYAASYLASIVGPQPGARILQIPPWGSVPGWAFNAHMALALGYTLVLTGEWDARRALELIDTHRCEWAMGVPSHLHMMLEVVRSGGWSRRLTSMRALTVGGSPMDGELITAAEQLLGLQALRTFGLSECPAHASTRLFDPPERRQVWDGLPFPGTSVEAYGSDDQVLPRGQPGEAGVKGPSLFKGYWPGLGAEEASLTADGAFLTGDRIVRDQEGFIRVVGRLKDQIIRGGLNIDPAVSELALSRYPAVREVAIVGRPDPRLGERICAVVVLRGSQLPTLADLTAFLEVEGVARSNWPEFLVCVDDLPKTTFGKPDKVRLRELVAGIEGR